ncbi:MAG: peptide deformylase [Patescibacteria group bacterium]
MLKILTNPHPILRKKAKEVDLKNINSKEIQELVFAMKEILKDSDDGVGLAAPQIGQSIRLFLISEEAEAIDKNKKSKVIHQNENAKKEKTAWGYHVFINPIIKKFSAKKIDLAEGCLSVPGIFGLVRRPEKITAEWHDEHGKKHSRGCSKFFARVIQHETDHLDGILFIEKMHKELKLEKNSSKL